MPSRRQCSRICLLHRAGDGPPGRIVRRVDVQRARPRRQRRQQPVEVERPSRRRKIERQAFDLRPQHLRNLDQVGPQRRHFHHAVARTHQRLRGQHQRRHARAGDDDVLDRHRPVQAATRRPPAPRAARRCRSCGCRTSLPPRSDAMPARRMNSGVSSSGSPNQKASTSLAPPRLAFATSRILEPRRCRTASRAVRWFSGTDWEGSWRPILPNSAQNARRSIGSKSKADRERGMHRASSPHRSLVPWSTLTIPNRGGPMSDEDLKAELEQLRKENAVPEEGRCQGRVHEGQRERGAFRLRHGKISGHAVQGAMAEAARSCRTRSGLSLRRTRAS